MTDGPGHILVVCHANICRSVVGAVTLNSELKGDTHQLAVRSAGVGATSGAQGCGLAAGMLGDPDQAELVVGNEAVELVDAVRGAGLVLTAERQQRGPVIRATPGLRPATFSLSEAVDLGRYVVDHVPASSGSRDLSRLVSEMDAVRGIVVPTPRPVIEEPRGLLRRRRRRPEVDPWDVPDAHIGEAYPHSYVVPRVQAEARAFAEVLRGWLDA